VEDKLGHVGEQAHEKQQSSDFSMSFSFFRNKASFSSRPALKIPALPPREELNAFFSLGWGTGWLCGI
jgi:hypothetical protein